MINFLKNNWHYSVGVFSTLYCTWMSGFAFVKYEPHLRSLSFLYLSGAIVTGSLLVFFKWLESGLEDVSKDLKHLTSGLDNINETLK